MKSRFVYILYIALLFLSYDIRTQPVSIEKYTFLNTSADTLVFYGKSENQFKSFANNFAQMIRLGNRQMKILHLGDSHIQADFYTGQVRKNFQSFMDGLQGDRGMITPFLRSAPDSYKITFSSSWQAINILSKTNRENLGLWGASAYTTALSNTININVNNKNPIKYDFNRLRIYHSELKGEDNLRLSDIPVAYQKIENKEQGYTEFLLADYITEVKITVSKTTNKTFYVYGFYFDSDNAGVVYNATGINGASADSYFNADKLYSHLYSLDFDMIIISLGTNDTYEHGGENTFEQNLTKLVRNIKNTLPDIPILLISPTECYWHKKRINPRSEQTNNIVRNVAKKTDCAYLDMYKVMGGKGASDKLYRNSLMRPDRVHLTLKGYQLQGDLLYNALWNAIEKFF